MKSIVAAKSLSLLELLIDATCPLVNISTVSSDSLQIRVTFTASSERDLRDLIASLTKLVANNQKQV